MASNNKIKNDLYVGKEHVNIEGRTIKHPAFIEHYANLNMYKTRDQIIDLIGMDFETNAETGELKLLGLYEGNNDDYEPNITIDGVEKIRGYRAYYTGDLYEVLFHQVKYATKVNKSLAHWNKLDAFQMFRLFAFKKDDPDAVKLALNRFGKIQGQWNKRECYWEIEPVISIKGMYYEFGIVKAIRGSIQFYVKSHRKKQIDTCWSYNIASLYLEGLEKEGRYDPANNFHGRFEWYSKVDESAHIVDWDRFYSDSEFRDDIVLRSNRLDAKVAMALGYEVQKDFKESFGAYPTSLISQGSHARSAVVAQVNNDLINQGVTDDEERTKLLYDEISSISLLTHINKWLENYDEKLVKDLYLRTCEAYSGGQIETIRYGYSKTGWYADIASAYPSVIQKLFDLRGSKLEEGVGIPPKIENAYIFCRGLVNMPKHIHYHPITIKHPIFKDTNIRPVGQFYASYTSEEREFCESIGATFTDESWIAVITTGKLSVLADVSLKLIALRNELLKTGSRAEGQVKRIGNSLYGILYEAVDIHEEIEETLLPEKIGYRAGEFWNSLFACIITSRTRLIVSSACIEIEKSGGEPILLMTDSITWKGKKTDLPNILKLPFGNSGILEKKTLGYFESPDQVKDIICFGAGRYGFTKITPDGQEDKYISKRRGMIIKDVVNDDKIELEDGFHWSNFMKLMVHYDSTIIKVVTRKLISTGILALSLKYTIHDLGRIVEEKAEIDLISGKEKRIIRASDLKPKKLATGLILTYPIKLDFNVYVDDGYSDGTLSKIRELVSSKILRSRKVRVKDQNKKRAYEFRENHEQDIKEDKKAKYKYMRDNGFTSYEASFRANYSWSRVRDDVELFKNDSLELKTV